jgi:uncharacterized BrkB/YihY/UPF0761 family membrane protein
MRITHPKLARPYRAWGYPVTPLIFLSVTLFMMYYLVVNRPLQSLAGVAMTSAGLVIYYYVPPAIGVFPPRMPRKPWPDSDVRKHA